MKVCMLLYHPTSYNTVTALLLLYYRLNAIYLIDERHPRCSAMHFIFLISHGRLITAVKVSPCVARGYKNIWTSAVCPDGRRTPAPEQYFCHQQDLIRFYHIFQNHLSDQQWRIFLPKWKCFTNLTLNKLFKIWTTMHATEQFPREIATVWKHAVVAQVELKVFCIFTTYYTVIKAGVCRGRERADFFDFGRVWWQGIVCTSWALAGIQLQPIRCWAIHHYQWWSIDSASVPPGNHRATGGAETVCHRHFVPHTTFHPFSNPLSQMMARFLYDS